MSGCGHDGWVKGCPECEREAELAGHRLEEPTIERGLDLLEMIALERERQNDQERSS